MSYTAVVVEHGFLGDTSQKLSSKNSTTSFFCFVFDIRMRASSFLSVPEVSPTHEETMLNYDHELSSYSRAHTIVLLMEGHKIGVTVFPFPPSLMLSMGVRKLGYTHT